MYLQSSPTIHTPPVKHAHFFPFFFLEDPDGVAAAEGVVLAASTSTPSSSDDALLAAAFSAAAFSAAALLSSSSSLRKSFWIDARRLSHHSFSAAAWDWISSSLLRRTAFDAISLADWKIVWPQLGARALACAGG